MQSPLFSGLIGMSQPYVTSPNLPTDRDVVSTAKDFAGATTLELTDEETKLFLEHTISIVNKHQTVWKTMFPFNSIEQCMELCDKLEQELAYTMAVELDVLVRVDATPVFEGQGPIVEYLGKMEGTSLDKYGQDHEKKTWEVQKAKERGEDFHHQKDNYRSQ
jgi:hypothetical protein